MALVSGTLPLWRLFLPSPVWRNPSRIAWPCLPAGRPQHPPDLPLPPPRHHPSSSSSFLPGTRVSTGLRTLGATGPSETRAMRPMLQCSVRQSEATCVMPRAGVHDASQSLPRVAISLSAGSKKKCTAVQRHFKTFVVGVRQCQSCF